MNSTNKKKKRTKEFKFDTKQLKKKSDINYKTAQELNQLWIQYIGRGNSLVFIY